MSILLPFRNAILFAIVAAMLIALPAQSQSLRSLMNQGNQAMSSADYVTAAYYYQRIFESPEWESFPAKIDVLSKLAMIEEAQSSFQDAARWYGEILNLYDARGDNQAGAFATLRYYSFRYAECLERAGEYQEATNVLQELLNQASIEDRSAIIKRLIENYAFLPVDKEDIQQLQSKMDVADVQQLAWELASLYQTHGYYGEANQLYDALWRNQPHQAISHIDELLETARALEQEEDLIQAIENQRQQEPAVDSFLLLEARLLRRMDRGEEALQLMRNALASRVQAGQPLMSLAAQTPTVIMEELVDLVLKFEGEEQAMAMLHEWLERQPMNQERRKQLAMLYHQRGDAETAIALWKDWAQQNSNKPNILLNAAEQVFSLGADEAAADMLNQLEGVSDPNQALQYGLTALRLQQYDTAIDAFNQAEEASQAMRAIINARIERSIENAANVNQFFDALVQSATGTPLSEVPVWMRSTIESLAFQHHRLEKLARLVSQEPSGAWRLRAAQTALQEGRRNWALDTLRKVPQDSPYFRHAEMEIAQILGQQEELPKQRRAANILAGVLDPVIRATNPVRLQNHHLNRLLDYANLQLNAFQPGEALKAIRRIESASDTLAKPLSAAKGERLLFLRGRALMELASFDPALEIFNQTAEGRFATESIYNRALIHLAQQELETARALFDQLASQPEHWKRANEALQTLLVMDQLVGEPLEQFCIAMLYEIQGRFEDAIPLYREIAVAHYGEDMEEWTRYWIGRLQRSAGNPQAALDEWNRLLEDVDHPLIHGLVRSKIINTAQPEDSAIASATQYQNLLLDFPDTLFADLARLELQQREPMNP